MAFEDLRAYYEAEADQRLRQPLRHWRAEMRALFIELVKSEARRSVVDFGAGPGWDVLAFVEAGVRAVGIDLAVGNAQLARESNLTVVPASVTASPLRKQSFAAGWSMSTLMHLDDDDAALAFAELASAVEPGGPIWVGVWGMGDNAERRVDWDESIEGQRRPFHRRTVAVNRQLFSAADCESVEEYELGTSGYQLFHLRAR